MHSCAEITFWLRPVSAQQAKELWNPLTDKSSNLNFQPLEDASRYAILQCIWKQNLIPSKKLFHIALSMAYGKAVFIYLLNSSERFESDDLPNKYQCLWPDRDECGSPFSAMYQTGYPANKIRWSTFVSMLGPCRRWWADIETTLDQRIVFVCR